MSKKEKYCCGCSGAKTEFEKEIVDFAYFIAKHPWMPGLIIGRSWINKLLSIAKKEVFEDMPKWKHNDRGLYEKNPVIYGSSLAYKDKFILITS